MSDKYEFIAAERATHSSENSGDAPTIVRMCAWIGVSKSGNYEWLDRRPSAAARRRELLADKIRALFEAFGGTYGYRRIHAELLRAGEHVGAELVRRLMRELGLVPVQPRPFRITTVPDPDAPETVDLLRRDFCADRPGIKVVGDITYIRTWQGWLYLATLIDCFNREVIGWSMADHLRTELVTDALDMAVRNHRLEPDCIMHSDRGTQYTSAEYRATLIRLGLRHSVRRRVNVGIMRWRNRFSPAWGTSECITLCIRHGRKRRRTLPATSNCSTINDEFTPHSATGHHAKSAPNT